MSDESLDPQQLSLLCEVNSVRMQNGKSGVGSVRNPRQYLKPGDVIRSEIPGLGVLENSCVAAS
ncbi:MAG TPA: hypothetical protein VF331_02220 [Polyangiales bacterium]